MTASLARVAAAQSAVAAAVLSLGFAVQAAAVPAAPRPPRPAFVLPDPGPGWDRWTADEFREYLGDYGGGVEVSREDTAETARCVAAATPGVRAWGPFLLAGPAAAVDRARSVLPGRRPGAPP